MALNIWTGLGRLCYEPELKKTQSGNSVASIRIYTDKDGNKRYAVKIIARNASFAGGGFSEHAQDDAQKNYREATGQNNASVWGKDREHAPTTSWTPPTPEQPSFVPVADINDDLPF